MEEVMIELRLEGRFRVNWMKDGWMVGMGESVPKRGNSVNKGIYVLFVFKFLFNLEYLLLLYLQVHLELELTRKVH